MNSYVSIGKFRDKEKREKLSLINACFTNKPVPEPKLNVKSLPDLEKNNLGSTTFNYQFGILKGLSREI